MSNQLRLMLERAISASRVSSALELPLDRKLGDLSRYKYVYADALPLRMERRISEQPSPNALSLAMSNPRGVLMPPRFVTSDALPLPLSVPVSNQPSSNALPLGLTRKLGTLVGQYVPPVVSNDVSVTIKAQGGLNPTASVAATADKVEIVVSITAIGGLNPTASAGVAYDANVFRGHIADVSDDFQQSKIQGIDRRSGFENNAQLNTHTGADWQQSKLVGAENQAQFEANESLISSNQALFEQSKLIADSSRHGGENQSFISKPSRLKYEQSKLVGHDRWFSFEAMAKRQIERAIHGENSTLIADTLPTLNESAVYIATKKALLAETARLPYSKLRYVAPPIWQTVILKEQVIDGWECGSGALRRYVYNDELPLPMTRRIADRGASSGLALPMDRPRGILTLSAADANALPNYPCKYKSIAVNPTLDVTMCKPIVFGQRSSMTANMVGDLDPMAMLVLLAKETGAYNNGVIFVTNSVSLNRTDDGREIKLFSFDVGIDSNSYAWSFNASVPLSELSKVNTAIEQRIGVDLTVNGHLWRLILDACDDTIAFGERSLTIKGKSRAMLLAHPYAKQRGYKYSAPLSARQIAEDELNRDGVPSGFTLNWNLVDVNGWNVPANTYSYTGKTPINSLQWIADAVGGFINADMSADIIHMLERYPLPSWEWAVQKPLKTLPQSLIINRSQSRINKPAYNGVQVWGERDGSVGALIKRTGTSGGYTPPMVTSDLITTNAAARSRGIAILSDTGDMGNIGITMPLHEDFGILKPSTLIGVNDGQSWVGMVRGNRISGKLSSNQTLEIEQQLEIERHYDKG